MCISGLYGGSGIPLDADMEVVRPCIIWMDRRAEALCDRTVAVTAPAELRVRRIMARDGIDERYARMRISAQKSDEFYRGKCDYELSNTAETPEDFREIARDFFRRLIGELREEKNEASR